MRRRIAVVLLLLLVASMAFSAGGSTIIFITETGEKYHQAGCSSLQKSQIPITLEEAVQRRYTPCKNCDPPILTEPELEPEPEPETL